MTPEIETFFDEATNTATHLAHDPGSGRAVVIDPVLDYDAASGRTGRASADRVIARVEALGLQVDWILETHAHADHLTAAPYLKQRLGARIGIGARITEVQAIFATLFNAGDDFEPDGRQFDRLFEDEDHLSVGGMDIRVLHTPGHTPACVTYVIGGAAFVGDTLFMPDHGTARCDFPGGDAAMLYRSIRRLFTLGDGMRLLLCHDYAPGGRAYEWETTVGAQRAQNRQARDGIDEAEFVRLREERDATLAVPALLLPAIQVNMRAGDFPPAEDNGTVYLKIPIDRF
ncbi:MBL fold metallo-hydrolase [Marivibrio halodurans]|uniref:MBL fold metallo-hydrolase n=1 Tax=Marivibrio halodurans TaxID=2039722 RepID=A0A8J7V4D8_9PROT|nr:MBL fold metallo-hydrolase [Marivibrio halodurans]MBP5858972.1 MBL fold metallo-hydrolase [Marivibrio halodurans]